MINVLIGYGIVAVIIAAGYVVGRVGLLGAGGELVLHRLVFFLLSPCLLFTILADADLSRLFSQEMPVQGAAVVVAVLGYLLVSALFLRRPAGETTIGVLASSYSNAGNIGIPIAVYVLGDAGAPVPILLLQMIVLGPTSVVILDAVSQRERVSLRWVVLRPLHNPNLLATLAGVLVAAIGVDLPSGLRAPLDIVGAAAIPLMLIAFGMSLVGVRPLRRTGRSADVAVASVLKLVVMPAIAFAVARFVFGLEGDALFVATALAMLPTGQFVYNAAARYGVGEPIARDTVLATSILSLPALVLVAFLLAPP